MGTTKINAKQHGTRRARAIKSGVGGNQTRRIATSGIQAKRNGTGRT